MTTTPDDEQTALSRIAADLIAHCPEHGTSTETWPECRCEAARKAAATITAVSQPEPPADTLPEWLNHRYGRNPHGWDDLSDDERSYWEHEAAAVRRAVARGGFKTPTADGSPAGEAR